MLNKIKDAKVMSDKIKDARETIRKAMKADPVGFEQAYVANISCLIYDELRRMKRGMAMKHTNKIAYKIVKLVFWN